MRMFLRYLFTVLLWGLTLSVGGQSLRAAEFRLAVLHANAEVFAYEISVLRMALEEAPGEHHLELIPMPGVNQKRILQSLRLGRGEFNVFFTGFSDARERDLLQVDIPITRGLLGHRIFIIHRINIQSLKQVRSLDDLRRRVTVGSGIGWPDTEVFRHAGFEVHEALYDNLWPMLSAGRYVGFNRGIHEAYVELEQRRSSNPGITIDDSLMVVYPFDYFFYFNRDDLERFVIVQQGLRNAYANGRFMENFNNHPMIRKVIADASPSGRRVFRLENPLLTDRIRAIPDHYWHRF